MKSRVLLVPFSALICLAIAFSAATAADPSVDDSVNSMTQSATTWSPELVGRQWGWRLTKYRIFDEAYKIDGQTLLLLSTEIDNIDNVLWNPLTGTGRHVDRQEYVKFWSEHARERVQSWLSSVNLYKDRIMQVLISPGQSLR